MDMAGIFNLLIAVIIVGGAVYVVNLLPLDATVKKVGTILVLVAAGVWAIKWLMSVVR